MSALKQFFLIVATSLALMGGCATDGSRSKEPETIVYAANGDFVIAQKIVLVYKALPPCEVQPAPIVCAKASVVEEAKRAENVAYLILSGAEAAVRNPTSGTDLNLLANAADEAVKAFKKITDTLKTQ